MSQVEDPDKTFTPVKVFTSPVPFNLTKPKPKMIPLPIQMKREVIASPVPKNMNKITLGDIEKEKEKRRRERTETIRREYEEGP